MIFETKRGLYWPIDADAEHVLNRFGFVSPLDWRAYEAMVTFLREEGEVTPELWEPDDPFSLPRELPIT
jgi:hypothetical protein